MTDMAADDQDRDALDLLLRGFEVSRMLRVVADLGVADRIPAGASVTIGELAEACNVLAEPLWRILRALSAFQVFRVTQDGSLAHTPRSILLRTDTPNSMHHGARFWTTPGSWAAWGRLDVALTGGVPHEAAWKMSRFDYMRGNQEEARIFDAMMANFPDDRHAAIAAAYDFAGTRLVADIGGGNGAALRQILSRYSQARGILFDRPDVVDTLSAGQLLDGRIEALGGSFFDKVPDGADIYLLMRVLHNWSDEDCVRMLRNCRAVMRAEACLLVVEKVLDPDPTNGPAIDYLLDVQMMAMFGQARERSEAEFRSLFERSGLSLRRVLPTSSTVSIVEAFAV
jgi:hypothetical protein